MYPLSLLREEHPCFGAPCGSRGRIHLPVAPRCNLSCAYCDRRWDCPNEARPGVASALLSPEAAAKRALEAVEKEPRIRVIGIAGPGEALYNEETFETLREVRRRLPEAILCLSTNGLLLAERLEELLACGLGALTVTVNAARPETGQKLCTGVVWRGQILPDETGIPLLLERQLLGIRAAAEAGLAVKVNTVLVPGVNDGEIGEIAGRCRQAGGAFMNVIPLIPCGRLSSASPPTADQLLAARAQAGRELPQFTGCRRCRADACGIM